VQRKSGVGGVFRFHRRLAVAAQVWRGLVCCGVVFRSDRRLALAAQGGRLFFKVWPRSARSPDLADASTFGLLLALNRIPALSGKALAAVSSFPQPPVVPFRQPGLRRSRRFGGANSA
jgi:hypothetical protein